MFAVIQAGGAGTRLKTISGDLPKGMVEIGGKPILEWQLLNLKKSGITEIVILISKNGDSIIGHFGSGARLGLNIKYVVEESPLGTAGGLYYVKNMIRDDFVLCFGDLMLDVDWKRFVAYHKEKKGFLTAFGHPNSHPFDSDLLVPDKENKILSIDSKNNVRDYYYENITNAGLYVCSKEVLKYIEQPEKIDFEKVVLRHFIEQGKAFIYRSSEYVKDCGTPERYYSVEEDIKNGTVENKSLRNVQKAIFLDRDGTINKYAGFITAPEQLVLEKEASEAIKLINKLGYLAIVVTNQPQVARGDVSFDDLRAIHNKLETDLGKDGAYIDAIYFCPHHPDKGFPGEREELKIECDCRKPSIGLLLKAKERFNIDFSRSWFIGDTTRDIQTGLNAGCKTVFLTSGNDEPIIRFPEATPDYRCKSLKEAVETIIKNGC